MVAAGSVTPSYVSAGANAGRLDAAVVAAIPADNMDGDVAGSWAAFRVDPWTGDTLTDIRGAANAVADLATGFETRAIVYARSKARRPGVIAKGLFTGGTISETANGGTGLTLSVSNNVPHIQPWASERDLVMICDRLDIVSSRHAGGTGGSSVNMMLRPAQGSQTDPSKTEDFLSTIEASLRLVIRYGRRVVALPFNTDSMEPYLWSFARGSATDLAMRDMFGQFLLPDSGTEPWAGAIPVEMAIIYGTDWVDGTEWDKAFDTYYYEMDYELSALSDDASPYTGIPSESDELAKIKRYARYLDTSEAAHFALVDSELRCHLDPTNQWVPDDPITPRLDRWVYCRTRDRHIVPPAIRTLQEQRSSAAFTPSVAGCALTNQPSGTNDRWPAEFASVSRWNSETRSYGEYSAWHIDGNIAEVDYRVSVQYPTGHRMSTALAIGYANVNVSFFRPDDPSDDVPATELREEDRILTARYVAAYPSTSISRGFVVAGNFALETNIEQSGPFVIGPAGEGLGLTEDDVVVSSAGGHTRVGVQYGYFTVRYKTRSVQVAVERAVTALPTLSTPTLTLGKVDSTVTLTISDIAAGATHWELEKATASGSFTDAATQVITNIAFSEKITETTRYRARVTGTNRTPSAWSDIETSTISETEAPLVIDDASVTNVRLSLGETATISPLLVSSGVTPVAWTVALFERDDYDQVSLPPSKLARFALSGANTETPSLVVQMPGGGNTDQTIDLNPKVITGISRSATPRTAGYTIEETFTVSDNPIVPLLATVTDSAKPTAQTDTDEFSVLYRSRPTLQVQWFILSLWRDITRFDLTHTAIGGHAIGFIARANVTYRYVFTTENPGAIPIRARWVFSESPLITSQWVEIPAA